MERLIKKYSKKLVEHGLCNEGSPLIGGLEVELIWNKKDPSCKILEKVINSLNITSILFAEPAEPYFSILNYLSFKANELTIHPKDCETRTFLHDIPVSLKFEANSIIKILKNRKSVIIPKHGIITIGTISPEQTFIVYSSVCFALFVKFFDDYYYSITSNNINEQQKTIFNQTIDYYKNFISKIKKVSSTNNISLKKEDEVIKSIIKTGKLTVDCLMVDSFFGNISYKLKKSIYISQTGSSLDELIGCIDKCPINQSSCAAITASSEFSAHKDIYLNTKNKAILHGHPKFCVIMSLLCRKNNCKFKGQCHIKCPEKRYAKDIPIVSGEVGTGIFGLYRTLPPAIKNKRGVIVYGHGLFTADKYSLENTFNNLIDIETMCLNLYLEKVKENNAI